LDVFRNGLKEIISEETEIRLAYLKKNEELEKITIK